jgi:RNA polymerase sigma-70 factor (sigma-E family)
MRVNLAGSDGVTRGVMFRQLGADFDEFVLASSPRLLSLAYRLTGDRHLAEDMVQTCLWRMAKRWPAAQSNPVAYARQVLANLAKDGWRRSGRRPAEVLAPDPEALDRQPSTATEDRELLLDALRGLPPRQRTMIVLRYFEDLSVEETARLLRCSPGTVKSATSRGLARLRDALQDTLDDRSEVEMP